MWFKNLKIFRLSSHFGGEKLTLQRLSEAIEKQAFQPVNRSDMQNMGWVSPCNSGALVHALDGQYLLSLRVEKKLLPAAVVRQFTIAKAQEIEEQKGYKPGRKQLKEIKEQITDSLLPRAFSLYRDTRVWFDTKNHWLCIDTASPAKSDEVIGMLVKALEPLPVQSLFTEQSSPSAMTEWLIQDEAPANFSIDQDAELRSSAENRATIRYVRQTPEKEDAIKHIQSGKQCTRLALTWSDKVSFILDDLMNIKRIAPLDILNEGNDTSRMSDMERFEADMTLMYSELAGLIADLVAALGGEKARQ